MTVSRCLLLLFLLFAVKCQLFCAGRYARAAVRGELAALLVSASRRGFAALLWRCPVLLSCAPHLQFEMIVFCCLQQQLQFAVMCAQLRASRYARAVVRYAFAALLLPALRRYFAALLWCHLVIVARCLMSPLLFAVTGAPLRASRYAGPEVRYAFAALLLPAPRCYCAVQLWRIPDRYLAPRCYFAALLWRYHARYFAALLWLNHARYFVALRW